MQIICKIFNEEEEYNINLNLKRWQFQNLKYSEYKFIKYYII